MAILISSEELVVKLATFYEVCSPENGEYFASVKSDSREYNVYIKSSITKQMFSIFDIFSESQFVPVGILEIKSGQ